MKILAINASHRGDRGLTRFFIDRLFDGARASGADCEVITLAKYEINRCLSCYRCQTPEHRLRCVYGERDDVQLIFGKMIEADILVFATPVYLMSMTGLLKVFLDRLYGTMSVRDARLSHGLIHHHVNPLISSKPFVTLVVCGNIENEASKNVVSYFRTYARFMESKQVGVLVRNASSLFDHANNPRLATDFPKTLEVCKAFERAGSELATLGHIRRSTQRKANQEVIPVPLFSLLKRFRPVKKKVVEYLRRSA